MSVGVVSISPGTVLAESLRKPLLAGVGGSITSEVVVLLAVVSSDASTSTST